MRTDHNKNLTQERMDKEKLLDFINNDVIGRDAIFEGPFGPRNVLYCDYVASGKALHSIESYIQTNVLAMYGNTHTTTTVTSSQTTLFRQEAKEVIRRAVGANDGDVIIFTGSGVTGAVHKLISVLNLTKPPVIFCGPFEHHSNILPWREMCDNVAVVNISETSEGKVNLKHLEVALKMWKETDRPMIGTFSAASNVTGITTDTRQVSALLHKYNAMSLWDYATAGPYMNIQMHPEPLRGNDTSKDAVFISMHKFLGSPDAPGLLIASKRLFRNRNQTPSGSGGGTVSFVTENNHHYLHDIESREEGGTPAIVGSIRAGIAFKLKESVGSDFIMMREDELHKKALDVWKDIPELEILGQYDSINNKQEHKIAVFSFLIRHQESGYYLHYNFVTALLNDLFGIQSRGGCACAGIYAINLLGITNVRRNKFENVLVPELANRGNEKSGPILDRTEHEILRPGFTRLNFAYFMSDKDADYVINAVAMIATHGWLLLPQYKYDLYTGEWRHVGHDKEDYQTHLKAVHFDKQDEFNNSIYSKQNGKDLSCSQQEFLQQAEMIFLRAKEKIETEPSNEGSKLSNNLDEHELRWFILPHEVQEILKGENIKIEKSLMPISVRKNVLELTDDEIKHDVIKNLDVKRIEKQNRILNAIANSNVRNTLRKTSKIKNTDDKPKPPERTSTLTENNLSRDNKMPTKKLGFWDTILCRCSRSVQVTPQNTS